MNQTANREAILPIANLWNVDGLPAGTFRSDIWQLQTQAMFHGEIAHDDVRAGDGYAIRARFRGKVEPFVRRDAFGPAEIERAIVSVAHLRRA